MEHIWHPNLTPTDIAELEHENKLLRARNNRLETIISGIVPRLESACGKNAMPPTMIKDWIEKQ